MCTFWTLCSHVCELNLSWKVLEYEFCESWKTLEFGHCKSWKVLENSFYCLYEPWRESLSVFISRIFTAELSCCHTHTFQFVNHFFGATRASLIMGGWLVLNICVTSCTSQLQPLDCILSSFTCWLPREGCLMPVQWLAVWRNGNVG